MGQIESSTRTATMKDLKQIFELGCKYSELKCINDNKPFCDLDDLKSFIKNKNGLFLIQEIFNDETKRKEIFAFSYVVIEGTTYGCVTYVVVENASRNIGYGSLLLQESLEFLNRKGIKYVYSLTTNSNAEQFFQKNGFIKGNVLTYMSRSTDIITGMLTEKSE